MQIKNIAIANFRKFEHLELNLAPNANILIGNNATGKTTILEALRIAIGSYLYGINSQHATAPSIHKTKDVRFEQDEEGELSRMYPTQIRALGLLDEQEILWERSLNTAKGKTTKEGLNQLLSHIDVKAEHTLPILLFYSTARLQTERKDTVPYKKDERFEAYFNALEASSSVKRFMQWFENEDRISYQNREETWALKIVSEAIQNSLPDCEKVYYDAKLTQIVVENHNGQKTPFTIMSDGFKLITSMVGDIAYRCAVLNKHLKGDCLKETEGVILIDEIEMHLHPEWQQKIVNDLQRIFPKIQFVITTHSPIVLSGAKANVIRLNLGESIDFSVKTYGRKPEHILYAEQGVNAVMQDIQKQKDLYYLHLSEGELGKAKEILDSLFIGQFGEEDPETVKALRDYEFALEESEEDQEGNEAY